MCARQSRDLSEVSIKHRMSLEGSYESGLCVAVACVFVCSMLYSGMHGHDRVSHMYLCTVCVCVHVQVPLYSYGPQWNSSSATWMAKVLRSTVNKVFTGALRSSLYADSLAIQSLSRLVLSNTLVACADVTGESVCPFRTP